MTPPVLLPAAVAVAAVALGLLLGLLPSGRARLAGPLRTFALAAALTVVVTHRLDNVRMADRILVLDQGRIREQGTFDDLVTTEGSLLAELYALSRDR